RYLLVGMLAIIVLAPQASASQAPPDASILNPPPLPFMSCKRVGSGTTWDGERKIHEDNVDTGITCGSGPEAFRRSTHIHQRRQDRYRARRHPRVPSGPAKLRR